MKAFDEIYALYARRLFAFCLKYTKSKENAEEIMEDTFVWLWKNRSTLEEADSVNRCSSSEPSITSSTPTGRSSIRPYTKTTWTILTITTAPLQTVSWSMMISSDSSTRCLPSCPRRSRKSSDSPSWRCSTIRRLPRNSTIVNRPLRTSCRWV